MTTATAEMPSASGSACRHPAGVGAGCAVGSESSTLTVPSLHVGGLQVPVDHPGFMRGLDGLRNLLRNGESFIQSTAAARSGSWFRTMAHGRDQSS